MKQPKHSDLLSVVFVAAVFFGMSVAFVFAGDHDLRIDNLAACSNRYGILKGMPESEIEPLRAALRSRVSSGNLRLDSKAHLLLIEMGERTTMEETRRLYEGDSVVASFSMQRQMQRSSQPAVIPLVAQDLFRDEPAKMGRINSEFIDYPLSVRSADIIRHVLINSPEFPADVRRWAASYNTRDAEKMRNAIRAWWVLNKQQIEQVNYEAVVPVSLTNQP